MKVAALVESRRENWRALEQLCNELERVGRLRLGAAAAARFGSLYRAACADLALCDAYRLPPGTVEYLHQLVGRAHNQLYRSRRFDFTLWGDELFRRVPYRLLHDRSLWLASAIFWGIFLGTMGLSYFNPGFAEQLVGRDQLSALDDMYSQPLAGRGSDQNALMLGFYIWNNAGIGMQCFALGMLLGVGGLFATTYNAAVLGGVFGYMAGQPARENFFHFVTAHGPFELTAIVMSAAAGMRLGFSLIDTGSLSRGDALRASAYRAMPTMGAAVFLFVGAALIEGFVSPSSAPYYVKAGVGIVTAAILLFYVFVLGARGSDEPLDRSPATRRRSRSAPALELSTLAPSPEANHAAR